MSNTNANFEMTGILLGQEVRKRKTPQEKIDIIQQTMEPGMNECLPCRPPARYSAQSAIQVEEAVWGSTPQPPKFPA